MGSPKSIQREHIDSLFVSDHLQIVPQPNGGLRRFMHFHIKFPSKSCHDECVPYSCPTHRNLLLSASSHTDCNYDIWYDICSIMFVGCCGTVWFGDVLGHWWQILIVHDSTMASWPWFRGYAFHAEKQRCPQCNLCALCEKRIVFVYEQLLDITLW